LQNDLGFFANVEFRSGIEEALKYFDKTT